MIESDEALAYDKSLGPAITEDADPDGLHDACIEEGKEVVDATEDSVQACRDKIELINPSDYAWLDEAAANAAMAAERSRLENVMRNLAAVPVQTSARGFLARRLLQRAIVMKEQQDAAQWAASIVVNSVCRTPIWIVWRTRRRRRHMSSRPWAPSVMPWPDWGRRRAFWSNRSASMKA